MTMPPELFNRTGDNWRGLFSIAEAAGGKWPELARQAAMEGISEEDSNLILQLLEAIWQIFAEKKVVRMHTKALLDALVKIDEAPWEEANNGREIDGYWLREKLKGFLPRPANPKEAAALRRSREWREGKGPPSRATRKTICAKPGGAISSERRRARQPKRPSLQRARGEAPDHGPSRSAAEDEASRRPASGPAERWNGRQAQRASMRKARTTGHGPAPDAGPARARRRHVGEA